LFFGTEGKCGSAIGTLDRLVLITHLDDLLSYK
jgi:hypothetical protein